MNAVARLHEAVVNRPRCRVVPLHFVISYDEARELDQLIADLCPDHDRCPGCGAVSCPTCGIDEQHRACICSPEAGA